MNEARRACQSEMKEVFDKLISLREESYRQFSDIIDSHNSSVSKGINDLVNEVYDLRAELSLVRKEKSVLIETVDNLNVEIRQLGALLLSAERSPKAEEIPSIIEEAFDLEIERSTDSACYDTHGIGVEQEVGFTKKNLVM